MENLNKPRRSPAQERLNRLPLLVQAMISDRQEAEKFVVLMSLARDMAATSLSPTRGFGLAGHDACLALLKDALGIAPLSDEEFEHALRLSTPPEYRETMQ